jgi:hypothetical protein
MKRWGKNTEGKGKKFYNFIVMNWQIMQITLQTWESFETVLNGIRGMLGIIIQITKLIIQFYIPLHRDIK